MRNNTMNNKKMICVISLFLFIASPLMAQEMQWRLPIINNDGSWLGFLPAYGGDMTEAGAYRIHTFRKSNIFVVNQPLTQARALIIGAGGRAVDGGGGAGGMIETNNLVFSSGIYTVTVGRTTVLYTQGIDTVFYGLTAYGGGQGGPLVGTPGGSGGGGGGNGTEWRAGGAGIEGQGHEGGSNRPNATYNPAGGGGGAGTRGSNAPSTSVGGKGGDGLPSDIYTYENWYAGGGGGSVATGVGLGLGGRGGGGNASLTIRNDGEPGTGGGGGGVAVGAGGYGGSGLVVVRYLLPYLASTNWDTMDYNADYAAQSTYESSFVPTNLDITVNMTSDVLPAPQACSASTENNPTHAAWYCFDGVDTGTYGWNSSASDTNNAWILYDWGTNRSRTVTVYDMVAPHDASTFGYAPRDWILYGSNYGSRVAISEIHGITWTNDQVRKFYTTNTESYRYYIVSILTNNGTEYNGIQEIRWYGLEDVTTNMTSNTAPSPLVAAASSTYAAGYEPYRAFTAGGGSLYLSVINDTNGWLSYDWGTNRSMVVAEYTMAAPATVARMPKNWKLYGSNYGSRVELDSRTDQTSWVASTRRYYQFVNTTAYRYYYLVFNGNNGNAYNSIQEIRWFHFADPPSLLAYSESTIKTQGMYSLKVVAFEGTSSNLTLRKTLSNYSNLAGFSNITFDLYGTITNAYWNFNIVNENNVTNTFTPVLSAANTWTNFVWDVSGITDTNRSSIASIFIKITNASISNRFYIDNLTYGLQ